MANQQHVTLLRQGITVWNTWKANNQNIHPDLSKADLRDVKLYDEHIMDVTSRNTPRGMRQVEVHYIGANLVRANLRRANLSRAILKAANLKAADLTRADLSMASFEEANLGLANLSLANLKGTDFWGANLSGANLSGADLGAVLVGVDLSGADLSGADLSGALIGGTIFSNIDLRAVKGLEAVEHYGPSDIGTSTFERSKGNIPDSFLRKAGVSETFIEYAHSLTNNPIEYNTCFISYSSQDQGFAERLYADLQSKGVRCWFAPEDMKIGDKIRLRIDESIRLYDKLLIVLSEHSIESDWVEYEVETALAKERKEQRTVLFPICLDKVVMESTTAWAAYIKNNRHLGDFTRWKNHDEHQEALSRLLRDLKAEAQKLGVREVTTNGG